MRKQNTNQSLIHSARCDTFFLRARCDTFFLLTPFSSFFLSNIQMIFVGSFEAVHRQFRKLTKTKGAFPNQDSLLKLLYMGIQNASKKWTMPVQNWSLTISQLAIFFEGRLDKELNL